MYDRVEWYIVTVCMRVMRVMTSELANDHRPMLVDLDQLPRTGIRGLHRFLLLSKPNVFISTAVCLDSGKDGLVARYCAERSRRQHSD